MTHGRGQAIDLAQYEAIHRTLGGTMIEYFETGLVRERLGNRGSGMQPIDSFETKDGFVNHSDKKKKRRYPMELSWPRCSGPRATARRELRSDHRSP